MSVDVDNQDRLTKLKERYGSIEELRELIRMQLGLPIPTRQGSSLPWGYKVSEEDKSTLVMVKEQFELLLYSKTLLKEYSFRRIGEWLTEKSGRLISHEALRKIMLRRPPDERCFLSDEEKLNIYHDR